jgi:hypothetical protein
VKRCASWHGQVSSQAKPEQRVSLGCSRSSPGRETFRHLLGLTLESRVVVISTEGAIDPATYARIVELGSP